MRIERTGAATAKAVITGNELRRAGLTASDLLNGSAAALPLISEMAEKAFPEGGRQRISVEIYPAKWGGCFFIMTRNRSAERLCKMIITAYSADSIIELCRRISELRISCPESSLVGGKDHLRLIACLPEEMLLLEGSFETRIVPADDNTLAKLSEHDRTIIPKNAVALLAKLSHGTGCGSHIALEEI
ncbi:MAG: hypothetical protein J6K92_12275 [Oscillospiraceae bacterium]|nr:hypothetical protein [Oscillospiraceae bacterium]